MGRVMRVWEYALAKKSTSYVLLGMFALVYFIPLGYMLLGEKTELHFFSSMTVTELQIISVFILQFVYCIYWVLLVRVTSWADTQHRVSFRLHFLLITIVLLYGLPFPVIAQYFFILVFISLCGLFRIPLKIIVFYMFFIGLEEFLFRGGRMILVNAILLLAIFSIRSTAVIIFSGFLMVLISVYVLLPMRHGVPVIFDVGLSEIPQNIYRNVTPILIGAFLSFEADISNLQFFADYFPFGRTVLGETSIIDRVAFDFLPVEQYQSGTRLGSNSAIMYKWSIFFQAAFILLFFYFYVKYIRLLSSGLNNALVIYLLWNMTVIPRRSFTTFIADTIALTVVYLLIMSFLSVILYKNKSE